MSIMLILFPSLRLFNLTLTRLAIKNISINYRSPKEHIISVSLYASNSIKIVISIDLCKLGATYLVFILIFVSSILNIAYLLSSVILYYMFLFL